MAKFIKVHYAKSSVSREKYINVDSILEFYEGIGGGKTFVRTTHEVFYVTETEEDLLKLINE